MLDAMTRHRRQRGLTLAELLITIAVAAALLTIAAPSFREFILTQRLKSINGQLVTDLQYARSEAAARGLNVTFRVSAATADSPQTCYIIYTDPSADPPSQACGCHRAAGARCDGDAREIRTVAVPTSDGVALSVPIDQADRFTYDPIAGGIRLPIIEVGAAPGSQFAVGASVDAARSLLTVVGLSGRPSVCSPSGSTMHEPSCDD